MTEQRQDTRCERALYWLMALAIVCAGAVLSKEIHQACVSMSQALNGALR